MIDFKKIKLIQAVIFLCTILGLGLQFMQNRKVEKDNKRLSECLVSIESKIEKFGTKDGGFAFRTKVLALKPDELKRLSPELISELQNLRIRPRNVKSITTHIIKDSLVFHTIIRDSIIYDTLAVRIFDYSDSFYSVKALQLSDTAYVNIQSTDTLLQVVHLGKRLRPWLWFFSKRELVQSVRLANPNAKLSYSKHIQITKP